MIDVGDLLDAVLREGLEAGPTALCSAQDMLGLDTIDVPPPSSSRPLEAPAQRAARHVVELMGSRSAPTPAPPSPQLVRWPPLAGPLAVDPSRSRESFALLMIALASAALIAAFYVVFWTPTLWPVLSIECDPPEAAIYVDGRLTSVRSPAQLKVKPNQRHSVEARAEGYRSRALEVPIRLRFLGTGAVALTLEPSRLFSIEPMAPQDNLRSRP
jgi:hypothetical protein